MKTILLWDIYEVHSESSSLNGIMLRGRIRKLGLENNFNILVENTEDCKNGVRFAVMNDADKDTTIAYLKGVINDVKIELVLPRCPNPVLSKLKVNSESRYRI